MSLPAILDGLRLVDLCSGRAGALACMLLAEAGAEVIRVEAPEGDGGRTDPAFAVPNRSKRSLVLDLASSAGIGELCILLGKADVLVHDMPDGALGGLLRPDALRARFPHLIDSHVGSWPAGHPNAGTAADNDLVMAQAGICDEQKAGGRDGPNFLRFPLGEAAAYLAAIGIVVRLLLMRRTRLGGSTETSLLQGALTSMIMLWSRAEQTTKGLADGYNKQIEAYLCQCSDDAWIHVMSSPDRAPSMQAGLEALDPEVRKAAIAARPGAPSLPSFGANLLVFRTKPRQAWLDELWAHDVSVQPVLPMGTLYHDAQARANGYVVSIDDPVLGPTLQPGSPMQLHPPARVRGPAPRRDDGRALADGWQKRPRPEPGEPAPQFPLAGLKVLDLGSFLAGPFAPMVMAVLGAEVIKLEATGGDIMRHAEWAFAACQRGKRSIALDLKHPGSRKVLTRLVEWADVVHHNQRMPAARKLGLDYETLRAINPAIVYCHVSSYGPAGPRKDWPGYDQLFQASCGWEYEGAGEGNPPVWYRFGMMDHQCALASLLATLLALHARDRTGQGSAVAASLLGAGMMTLRETVMLPDGSLTPYARLDGRQLGTSERRRLFRCKDGWAMVLTEAPGSHAAFLGAIGAASATRGEAAIAKLSVQALVAIVTRHGGQAVRAAQAQREPFLDDPANRAAGLVASYPHPAYGAFEQIGSFMGFHDMAASLDRAPPLCGQHSAEILRALGFDDAEIDSMAARKLIACASPQPA